MGVSPGRGSAGSSQPGGYLASAGVARTVCVGEVLPVGIHLAVVGAALTAGAAGTWAGRWVRAQLIRAGGAQPGVEGRSGRGTHQVSGWGAGRGLGSRAQPRTRAPHLGRSRLCRADHQAPTGRPQQTPLHQAHRLQKGGRHHGNLDTSTHPPLPRTPALPPAQQPLNIRWEGWWP